MPYPISIHILVAKPSSLLLCECVCVGVCMLVCLYDFFLWCTQYILFRECKIISIGGCFSIYKMDYWLEIMLSIAFPIWRTSRWFSSIQLPCYPGFSLQVYYIDTSNMKSNYRFIFQHWIRLVKVKVWDVAYLSIIFIECPCNIVFDTKETRATSVETNGKF